MSFDFFGVEGLTVDYAMIFFFTGSALILFLYLWYTKRLDFDEAPKYQIFKEDDSGK